MRKKKSLGFTLIELIMVMIIVGILAGVSVHPLSRFFELWLFNNAHLEVLWGSRGLMRELSTNMRMVKDKQSVFTATGTRFRFRQKSIDNSNPVADYQFLDGAFYKNGNLIMNRAGCPGNKCFTYYNCSKVTQNCTEVAAPVLAPAETNINALKVDITGTRSGETVELRVIVFLRNLQ